MRGSNEESLIDIPSRTSQTDFSSSSRTNNRIQSTTTDRPSFLPPKETVLGNIVSLGKKYMYRFSKRLYDNKKIEKISAFKTHYFKKGLMKAVVKYCSQLLLVPQVLQIKKSLLLLPSHGIHHLQIPSTIKTQSIETNIKILSILRHQMENID